MGKAWAPPLPLLLLCSALACSCVAQMDVLRAMTTARCSSSPQCPENAECLQPQGFCQCKRGFVYFEDLCVAVAARLGDRCLADVQCEVAFGADAECGDLEGGGACRCENGTHFAENKCHQSVRLGDKCVSRSDCYSSSGANVYCLRSVCTCHQGYHPSSDRRDCVMDRALGESCQRDEECVANDALCYGSCSCQAGFVAAADSRRCLQVAHGLGERCEVDAQCVQVLPMAACRAEACVCKDGAHQLQAKCWKSAGMGEVCEHWQQCVTVSNLTGSVACAQNRCRCSDAFHATSTPEDCTPNSSHVLQSSKLGLIGLTSFILILTVMHPVARD